MIQHRRPYCELLFKPSAALISVVRRFVTDFYDRVLEDDEDASRVALATHELLENAVKYSLDGAATLRIELLDKDDSPECIAIVRTFNRTSKEQIAILQERFAEIQNMGDPNAYYQTLMRRNMKRVGDSSGGLGLARIAAEALMSLSLDLEGDQVCVVSHTRVRRRLHA
jgi:hypothetical protein